MPKMISLQPHTYARTAYGVGDTFQAEDRDVRLLTALGRARLDDGALPSQEYRTREMTAQPRRARRTRTMAS